MTIIGGCVHKPADYISSQIKMATFYILDGYWW